MNIRTEPHAQPTQSPRSRRKYLWAIFASMLVIAYVVRFIPTAENREAQLADEKKKNFAKFESELQTMTLEQHLTAMRAVTQKGDASTDDELVQATEHGRIAKDKTPNNKEVARLQESLLHRLSARVVKQQAAKIRGSRSAGDSAYVSCKIYVENHLRAPSTAIFQGFQEGDVGYWPEHDFMFLANVTVDAENSFGAKLLSKYQCQVECLTTDSCQVTKTYELER
jgi:hypothetical protein